MSYTLASLGLSQVAYDEIKAKLRAAGYQHTFMASGMVNMNGIGVVLDPDAMGRATLTADAGAALKAMTGAQLSDRVRTVMHDVRELRVQTASHTGESTGNLDVLERRIADGVRELAGLEALQSSLDLDAAGEPKLPLTHLEALAVKACNQVKAWAESDRKAPFPADAHMLADGVLMLAAQRRQGVR